MLWGTVVGLHGSTMRAAVADLAPAARRGLAYGVFSAAYGLAWLVGATLIGALYARSLPEVELLAVLTQALALVVFVPLLRSGGGGRTCDMSGAGRPARRPRDAHRWGPRGGDASARKC